MVILGDSERSVRLSVERVKGRSYRVEVGYQTMQTTSQEQLYSININPALEGEDYTAAQGTLEFQENKQVRSVLKLTCTVSILT